MSQKLSTVELRKRNRNLVFRYFHQANTPKTKQDIAYDLSLSLPTVTQNLRDLIEVGVIEYVGAVESTGGRRARTMALAANARFSVGIELSPEHINIVAVNLHAEEIAYKRLACQFSNDAVYRKLLAQSLEACLDEWALDRGRLLGVGLTLPGIIDEANGIVEIAPVLRIRKMSLSLLTEQIPYPVYVENDASAGGYAEWWNRCDLDSMAYLFLGRGVGGALLINGKPYAGVHCRSAEFGHICIVPDGALCNCGKHGCFEAYCSIARLTDDLGGIHTAEFFAGLQERNPTYGAVWTKYLDYLAIGINTIRMIMDCDVILGGLLTPYMEPYLPDLRARLSALNSFGGDGRYFHLGKCQFKANSIGVALHFIDRFVAEL